MRRRRSGHGGRAGAVVLADRDAVVAAQALLGGEADVGSDVRVRLERHLLRVANGVVWISQAIPPFVR